MPRLSRLLLLIALPTIASAAAPRITDVVLEQRTDGSGLVDITYDAHDSDGDTLTVALRLSADGGATWDFPARNLSGDVGPGVQARPKRHIVWDAGAAPDGIDLADVRAQVLASDAGVVMAPHSPRNVAVTDFSAIDWARKGAIEQYGRADLLQLMGAQLWTGGPYGDVPVLDSLRQINPDLKIVAYVSAKTAQLSGGLPGATGFWRTWYERTRPFWVYTTAGDTAQDFRGNVVINILDPACRRAMLETIVEHQRTSLNRFDGVYWDYFNTALWVAPGLTVVGDPDMDGDGIGHWSDPDETAAYRAAQVSLVTALRDSLGEGFIQVFNGQRAYADRTFAALADGAMYELFPTLFFPDPDMAHALDPDYPYSLFNVRPWFRTGNGGPYLVLANTWISRYTDHRGLLTTLNNGNQWRAVAMVADCYASWHQNDGSTFSNTYAWTDNDISVGAPLGPPVFDGIFIRRDFQYGSIEIEMKSGKYPDPFKYRIRELGQLVEELAVPYHYP